MDNTATPTPGRFYRSKKNPGRSFYRALTAKTKPLDISQCSQRELLEQIFNPRAADGLMRASGGDFRNLAGRDIRDLIGIEGMSEAFAARLAAIFALFNQMAQR